LSDQSEFDLSLVNGLKTLEVGGPTLFAGAFYAAIADGVNEDDVNLFTMTVFPLASDDRQEGDPFVVPVGPAAGLTLGSYVRRHGAHLHGMADGMFGLVFASHCLEHFVDPLGALFEWDRVLAPGGFLLLVLPHARHTFDFFRGPVSVQELFWLHNANATTDEDLLSQRAQRVLRQLVYAQGVDPGAEKEGSVDGTRSGVGVGVSAVVGDNSGVDAVSGSSQGGTAAAAAAAHLPPGVGEGHPGDRASLEAVVFGRCPAVSAADVLAVNGPVAAEDLLRRQGDCRSHPTPSRDQLREPPPPRAPRPPARPSVSGGLVNEAELHWHVFDFNLLEELVTGCLGYELRFRAFQAPFHQIILAQKPPLAL
jgi:SAM-dependent methyltransferase